MLECLILGDSIAVGIGQARTECVTLARSGISSVNWYKGYSINPFYKEDKYRVVVISLGTNDMVGSRTSDHLFNIRKNTNADMVIWVLPSWNLKPQQNAIVRELANEFHDRVVAIHDLVGPDGIHPPTATAYKKVGDRVKELSNESRNNR